MAAEQLRLNADERADLVAYLDGELTGDRSRAIAEKLTRSVSGRREVEALESTWGLLDLLPRPRAGEEFAERTLSQVIDAPTSEARLVGAARETIRRVLALAAIAAVVSLGAAAGYAAARWLWPDPTARLARDLTIAERLDDYQAVGGLDFLRRLDQSPLFKETPD
ncbi:hypothetical protein ElP_60310 [Tautonia plasticadhaerens]|uniref:Zinc-finger domain-containing protein n=2 Tax=Tautonia plasticadhaerens TaxID=2527974 RepID=A0A518HB44_9BACT|nr:hypothetical protein ElP_60310 [Tautonia plasticadhaerens]